MAKTYEELSELGREFLAHCGHFSIDEHDRFEEPHDTSANEMLGLATRILSEQAKLVQELADKESHR